MREIKSCQDEDTENHCFIFEFSRNFLYLGLSCKHCSHTQQLTVQHKITTISRFSTNPSFETKMSKPIKIVAKLSLNSMSIQFNSNRLRVRQPYFQIQTSHPPTQLTVQEVIWRSTSIHSVQFTYQAEPPVNSTSIEVRSSSYLRLSSHLRSSSHFRSSPHLRSSSFFSSPSFIN